MRRTRFTPGRFKMLTLPALSDCGHARHIRRESITPVLRQWTLPRGSQHPRFRPLQQGVGGPVSIAHEVSGLGSTRVVRFSVPKGSGDDGTGTVATGPENAEVQGRFEPLGAAGAVGNGRGGDSGGVGAAISVLPAVLQG